MANLITDGQKELDAFYRMVDYLEQQQLYGAEDKRTKLANQFFSYCKTHDGQRSATFKLIPGKFREEFEQRLMEANLPFAVMSDGRGNFAFLTRNIDSEEFLQIQQDIFKGHTEYYKELNLEEFLDREYRDNTDVLVMKFDSLEELEMFRNKSYENGKGFVIATEEVDGKFIAYASMKDAISNDLHSDIPSTILRMQGDMSGITAGFKKSQIEYDLRVKEDILDKIKHGDSFTIVNGYDNRDSYLECVNGQLQFMEYNPSSGMFNSRLETPLSIPTNWSDEKEVNAFKDALDVQLARIKNKKIMEPDQHRQFMSMSPNELKEYAYEAKVKALEEPGSKGVGRPAGEIKFTEEYSQNVLKEIKKTENDIRSNAKVLGLLEKEYTETVNAFNVQPSVELEEKMAELKKEIESKKDAIAAKKKTTEVLKEKYEGVKMFQDHKRYMDRAMESVVTTAHNRIVHSPDYKLATKKEKEEMLENTMLDILRTRNTPELVKLVEFLESNNCLHEYDELIENVEKEFRDNVNVERIDKIKDRLEKQKEELERLAEEKEKKKGKEIDDDFGDRKR